MPRFSRRIVLLIGFVMGLGLWLLPGPLFGVSDPWGGNGPTYAIILSVCGILLGFLGPGRPGAATAGVFVGQLLVLLWRVIAHPESGWLFGVLLLAGYTFVFTGIGALLGTFLRRRIGTDSRSERRVSERRH